MNVLRSGRVAVEIEEAHELAPLDGRARLVTSATGAVVLVGVTAAGLVAGWGILWVIAGPALAAALLGLVMSFAPAGYALGPAELVLLRRSARPVVLPLAELERATDGSLRSAGRRPPYGSAGLFGWWGRLRGGDGSVIRAAASSRTGGILLTWRQGRHLYVSPELPEAFRAAVLERRDRRRRAR